MSERVSVQALDDGALWRVTFGQPPGNILDRATARELADAFHEARRAKALKAVCLEGRGEHFSYGASIQEHLPDDVALLLAAMHQLAGSILDSHVAVLAAVRGRCLGAGLEIAALCQRIFAAPEASFAQPEIGLGVFAPIASIVLPLRIGQVAAEELCLSGRTVNAEEARRLGLIDEISRGDAMNDALDWARRRYLPHSAKSLRYAVQAARTHLAARVQAELPELTRIYLDGLMRTSDAVEGLQAFLEKRRPIWTDE